MCENSADTLLHFKKVSKSLAIHRAVVFLLACDSWLMNKFLTMEESMNEVNVRRKVIGNNKPCIMYTRVFLCII